MILALALSFVIRTTIAEVRVVPSGSMEPTIVGGINGRADDRLFTVRILYRFSDPKRGDVVVFNPPDNVKLDNNEPFVKRLIGLPGDTIEVKDGKTLVNGKEYSVRNAYRPQYRFNSVKVPARGDVLEISNGSVSLNGKPSGISTRMLPTAVHDKLLRGERVKLDEDYFFMLGDNRNQSFDSHFWGFVPRKAIVARAVGIFWPPQDAKILN